MSDVGTEDAGDATASVPSVEPAGETEEYPDTEESSTSEVTESSKSEGESTEAVTSEPKVEITVTVAPEVESEEPSDAFEALGNETRMAVLRALMNSDTGDSTADDANVEENAESADSDRTKTFSELFEESPADTTAGFAYHLRQLTPSFVRKTGEEDDRYALTYAGSQVARAIAAGTYTDRVSFGPIATGDACPLCESGDLAAVCEANYVTVACDDCGRGVLTLPFPPGARHGHDPGREPDPGGEPDPGREPDSERLLNAFDRHHRHRLSVMSDGVCPECAATMDATISHPPDSVTEQLPDSEAERAQVRLDCAQCGCRLHAPVTLAVLEHPAVVAFFHDHQLNVRNRPIWNVGPEWSESVVSTDPWCVRVSVQLDDAILDLFVGEDASVAATRRRDADEVRQAS